MYEIDTQEEAESTMSEKYAYIRGLRRLIHEEEQAPVAQVTQSGIHGVYLRRSLPSPMPNLF